MPFINCSNCNKPYSAKSQKCPHCGAENTEYNSPKPQIEVADDIPQNHNENIHDINEFPYKYCQGCGKKLHIEAKVCPNCGYPVDNSTVISALLSFVIITTDVTPKYERNIMQETTSITQEETTNDYNEFSDPSSTKYFEGISDLQKVHDSYDGIMPVIKLDYEKYIIPTFFEYVRMFLEDVFK